MEENDLDHDRLFNPNNLIFTLFDEYGRPVSFSARNLTYDGLKDENGRLINGTKFLNSKVNPRCGVGKKSEIFMMPENSQMYRDLAKQRSELVLKKLNQIFDLSSHFNTFKIPYKIGKIEGTIS